eukprot:3904403-Rhodomonas_salina.6
MGSRCVSFSCVSGQFEVHGTTRGGWLEPVTATSGRKNVAIDFGSCGTDTATASTATATVRPAALMRSKFPEIWEFQRK